MTDVMCCRGPLEFTNERVIEAIQFVAAFADREGVTMTECCVPAKVKKYWDELDPVLETPYGPVKLLFLDK